MFLLFYLVNNCRCEELKALYNVRGPSGVKNYMETLQKANLFMESGGTAYHTKTVTSGSGNKRQTRTVTVTTATKCERFQCT